MTPTVALAFYRDVLGLELRNDVAREDFRWITVGAASQPGVAIVLTNYLNGSPADGDALAALVAKGALNGVHFHTDDLDATFERLRPRAPRSCRSRPTSRGARGTAPCATPPAISCASTSRPPRDRHRPQRLPPQRLGARAVCQYVVSYEAAQDGARGAHLARLLGGVALASSRSETAEGSNDARTSCAEKLREPGRGAAASSVTPSARAIAA